MLRINNFQAIKAIVIIWFFSLSSHISAQGLMDWLLDPSGTATKMIVDEVSKQANNAWEGILDKKIKESLSKDAQMLADFKMDTTALDSIDNFYDMYTSGDGQFVEIHKRQQQLIATYIWCSSLKPIGLMGNGAVREKIISKIDDLKYPPHQISSIELLSHNHPAILELKKLWEGNLLANNTTMLYYWAVLANRLDSLYPKKISFVKPQQLQLSNKNGNNKWLILSTERKQVLGEMSNEQEVVVLNEMLLNMAAMPHATYIVNDAKYKTDYLGRIISITFNMTSTSKQKSSIKGKIKPPKIMATYNAGKSYKPMELVPTKYNGVVGRLNIVPLAKTSDNKKTQKDFSKHMDLIYKKCRKESAKVPIEYQLSYSGRNECPHEISVRCDEARFVFLNGNNPQLSQVRLLSSDNKLPLEFGSHIKYQNEKNNAPTTKQLMTINKEYIAENNFIADLQKPVRKEYIAENDFIVNLQKPVKLQNNNTNVQEEAIIAPPVKEDEEEEEVVFIVVENMPEFPGGQAALFKYLSENVKYPSIAQENGIQGRVICQFVVDKDGSITDVEVVRSGGDASLDKEAVRVIKAMPKWNPGKQRGKAVRVKYTTPVNFKLQ